MNIQNTQSLEKQYGGTLLGLIIGLIIGLTIAVIVALVITKGTTPFTNKSGKQEKVAEPTVGQVADPNKPLYGNREAAKEAAKDFINETDASKANASGADGKIDAKPLKKAESKQDLLADGKVVADKTPKQDKSDVKQGDAKDIIKDAAIKMETADEKIIYYLQVGAFRDQSDAESARAKLALLGVEARITDRPSDTGVLYRVRIGPFSQVEGMNKIRSKLSENGVDVAVVRAPK